MKTSFVVYIVFLQLSIPGYARVYFVDNDEPADFNTIQAAIDESDHGDIIVLQPGIYTGTGNRDIDFNGKAVTVRSTNPQDPISISETVIDCQGTSFEQHRAFNFHTNEDANSVVDGLTLTGGYIDNGGAIICEANCSPTIRNCIIRGNRVTHDGGGIDCTTSKAVIINCLIEDNTAGVYAGGINCCVGSDLTVVGCTIRNNTAADDGGGIQFCVSDGQMIGCTIWNNTALEGGGIWCRGTVHISGCTIVGNVATRYGGAIAVIGELSTVTNCILWNNTPQEIYDWGRTPFVTYCDVKGDFTGEGNMDVDPCFVDPAAGNFRLLPVSPCIDAGDNNSVSAGAIELDDHPRIIDGDCNDTDVVDMGAYEFNYAYLGDFDYQCDVDLEDFVIFSLAWLTEPGDLDWNPICDISLPADNFIDLHDITIFTQNWLASIP